MNAIIQECLALVKPQFRLDLNHGWHGIGHWSRVWLNARELCETMKVDSTVPCYFAFLHDSQRFDEGSDHMHGPRACQWIDSLRYEGKLSLTDAQFGHLLNAISQHSNGRTTAHPIVQICWDSDRLDLGRVGMIPNPMYLCTSAAKKPDMIRRAYQRSIGEAQAS